MAYLDRDGVRIYYEVHGSGPAILLSHGYSATSAMWAGQVGPLSKKHTLILWDMRGHGNSDSPANPAEYSEALTTADMAALLDTVGAPTAAIGGLSLGGYMSLSFNVAYPQRVDALMLFDTGPGYRSDNGRAGWNKIAAQRAKELETKGLAALGASGEVAVSRHRSAQGLAYAARGMLAQTDGRVMESLPNIGVPTLVLVGSLDEPFLAATDYMAGKIPGASRVVIDGAGHASNIDKPREFNAAVEDFLAKL
ncbi:MAG TPA: alpha/beta fold hydrolase [Pseudomonadales bacterium]|nr:alpha/beta fold hydrolase [Pseudomonadales bacterium]